MEEEFDEDADFEEPYEDGYIIDDVEPPLSGQASLTTKNSGPYQIIPVDDVLKSLSRKLDELEEVLNIGLDWDLVLFANCRWNLDKCKE